MKRKLTLPFVASFIFALSAQAQVSTLYGNGNASYSVSNTSADSVNCQFNMPYDCAFDSKGNLWITDQLDNYIVMITGGKYQLREGYLGGGFNDGASTSQFGGVVEYPAGIIVVPGKTSANDQIYLCDEGNNAIRKIDSFVNIGYGQNMTTVAGGGTKVKGQLGTSGYTNGSGATALFKDPMGIGYVKDASGGYLVVADEGNNAVRKVSLHKSDYGTTSDITTTIPGPTGIFVDKASNIYVASQSDGIEEISNTGNVSTIVPSKYFEAPTSVVVTGTDMYIADGCRIEYFNMTKPASSTNPSVFAGDPADANCSYRDGSDSHSLFDGISSITLSPDSSYLVVTDAQNNRFRKVMVPSSNSGLEHAYSQSNMFNVYPNPSYGEVLVNSQVSGIADISLFTVTGKQVYNSSTTLIAGQPHSLNLGNLNSGVYILQISTKSGVYTKEVVLR